VVYHASYLRFLERARTEWLRAHGASPGACAGAARLMFAIASWNCVSCAGPPGRRADRSCALEPPAAPACVHAGDPARADDALLVDAPVRAACLDAASFKPRPCPTTFCRS
jgi:acyl-CoA thioester hydrolase